MNEISSHENKHDYNFFLDKELQKKLLVADEDEEVEEIQRGLSYWVCSQHLGMSLAQGQGQGQSQGQITKTTIKAVISKSCEFGAWAEEKGAKVKKPTVMERRNPQVQRTADLPWSRDPKPKDICFTFKHYTDSKKYIEQYRQDHTYNFGSANKDSNNQSDNIPKVTLCGQDSSRQQQQYANNTLNRLKSAKRSHSTPNSASQTPRNNSEPNLLELAHKYKLAPSVLREAHHRQASTLCNIQSPQQGEPLDNGESPQPGSGSRQGSASSQRGGAGTPSGVVAAVAAANTPGLTVTTTKVHNHVPQATTAGNNTNGGTSSHPSSAEAGKRRASSGSPVQQGGVTFFSGKTMKHLPSNGYAIDNQTIFRSTGSPVPGCKSPISLVMPSGGAVRTMDLLSHHANAVDKQMWFDASGRAYVSLATRYDPVKK